MAERQVNGDLEYGGAALWGRVEADKIAFDIDGVVADIMTTFIAMARDHYDLHHLRYDDIVEFDLAKCFDMEERIIWEILEHLLNRPHELAIEPLPAAVEVLTELSRQSPLLFVTARDREEPIRQWLAQNLAEVPEAALRVIATGDPDTKLEFLLDHRIEYFVEDRLETCFQLARHGITPIVFDQPWNRRQHPFPLVRSWQDIARLLARV